jgi:hypothetical protein
MLSTVYDYAIVLHFYYVRNYLSFASPVMTYNFFLNQSYFLGVILCNHYYYVNAFCGLHNIFSFVSLELFKLNIHLKISSFKIVLIKRKMVLSNGDKIVISYGDKIVNSGFV